ncbi:MAG: hypothetical protein NTX01_06930 [Candidatus Omnitrophica bacterium]|nr:hypothetical protein [Candidatus Omnitrophota bacterium]
MANILPKDEEFFKRIESERIQVDPLLWNAIYQHIGDPIIVINLTVRYYLDNGEPIPQAEANKVLISIKRMVEIINKIHKPESIAADEKDPLFRTIKEKGLKLDEVTDELFTQPIKNDLNFISIAVGMYIYFSKEGQSIPVEDGRNILDHIRTIMSFLDRLRIATSKKEAY